MTDHEITQEQWLGMSETERDAMLGAELADMRETTQRIRQLGGTRDERCAELSRTAKFRLILICRSGVRRPDGGLSYIEGAHPLEQWSKDDLISSILSVEHPGAAAPIPGGGIAMKEHDSRCLYCEHGPYCLTCPPPGSIPDDAYVCGPCREEITRSEITADPYYQGGAMFGDGS